LRPCRVFPGLRSPLADASERDIDFWIVREYVEGEYSAIGGRLFEGTDREMACQEAIFTRKGVDRAIEFAFGFAEREGLGRVTSATKSNGLSISMPFWDERFQNAASRCPGIASDQFHIDALCAHFVLRPEHFKVVVASNLFGDILSDLGPALCGSIGIAPSANLNPEKTAPSMFEPVHGSAPDIAGRSLANPIGQIWAGAMMLGFLGEAEAELRIMSAIEKVVAQGHALTPDLGGTGRTSDLGDAIAEAIIACRHDRSSIQSMET
jgi:tartrate dehydrogenase/decarboxylase/D-malate dehydrogenase